MLDRTCHITPDLISDYVADRLDDDDDARVVEEPSSTTMESRLPSQQRVRLIREWPDRLRQQDMSAIASKMLRVTFVGAGDAGLGCIASMNAPALCT